MARTRKVSNKLLYEPKDVVYPARWTFLEVLRKEYPDKVIALENVLPLYTEVASHPLWHLTPIGYDCGSITGEFEDERRNFLAPMRQSTLDFGEERGLPKIKYDELLLALQEWAKELGLKNTPWIYEVALFLLKELRRDSEIELPIFELADGSEIEIKSTRHPIISWIHMKANVVTNTWHIDTGPLPRVPVLPEWTPWQSEEDYRARVQELIDSYVTRSKSGFERQGFIERPEKRSFEKHCKWLAWRVVKGASWEKIAVREGDLIKKTISHTSVKEAVEKAAVLVGVRLN